MTRASTASILWPLLAQIVWTFSLYAWLTFARHQAVGRGEADYTSFEFNREEPPAVARIRLNLANQFELPVIFYAAVALLVALDQVQAIDVIAGWIFVIGRVIHTGVQTLTDNVPLRGRVFLINFMAVVVLVVHLAWFALQGIGS
ncbi:MAG: MAPEG family protein [Xanthobacteraceae bacterium]